MGESEQLRTADPSISVLVPSLNAGPFVGDAIRSALGQPIQPLEVLVQDGGSSDATVATAEAIADPRISIVSETDRGQSDALNRGVRRARGEWIVWLNADDLLAPDAFAAAAPSTREDVDVVYGDFAYVDAAGEITGRVRVPDVFDREQLLVKGHYLFTGAALFRRSLFDRFGELDTSLRMAMDYDFCLRIASHVRAVHCGATLGYFRQHGLSATSEISWTLVREEERVRRRHGGYSRTRTAVPILLNEVKRVADVGSLPIRKRLRAGTAAVTHPAELWLFDDAPILGGAQVFALRLAAFLAKRGSPRPRIVCPEASEMAERCASAGIDHLAAAFPPLGPLGAPRWPGAVLRSRSLLERAGTDVIVVGNTARTQAYLTAAALAFRPRARIVQLIHEQQTLERRSGRFALRRVGALVAVGGNVADACYLALPGIPIDQANLFLDQDGAAPAPPRPAGAQPAIGVLTRLIPEKGVLELVEELATAGSWSSALIAGRAQDPAYAERVRRRIESLGLGDRIRLIGEVDDLRSFFAAVDVLVVPSTGTEGQGFGIVEALWHSRPCLVRRSALSPGDFAGLPVLPFQDSAELDRGLRELPGQSVPGEVVRRRFGPDQALEAILRAAGRS